MEARGFGIEIGYEEGKATVKKRYQISFEYTNDAEIEEILKEVKATLRKAKQSFRSRTVDIIPFDDNFRSLDYMRYLVGTLEFEAREFIDGCFPEQPHNVYSEYESQNKMLNGLARTVKKDIVALTPMKEAI